MFLLIYVLVGLGVTAGFSMLSIWSGDYHIMNRGGAFLTAAAAALVVYEALFEERIKMVDEKSTERRMEEPVSIGESSPRQRLAQTLRLRRLRSEGSMLSQKKISLISMNAALAVYGELLHGFGDLALKIAWKLLGLWIAANE